MTEDGCVAFHACFTMLCDALHMETKNPLREISLHMTSNAYYFVFYGFLSDFS